MNLIYIGIDGGGSKTKLRMLNSNGSVLAETVAGPANIRLSVNLAHQSILNAFNLSLKQAGISPSNLKKYAFHVGIGLAGFEVKSAQTEFLKKKLPFDFVTLESDSTVACLGAHGGKNGSIVIAGTGVVGLNLCNGVRSQIGGWGFPHGDEGGGAWLGLESVKILLHTIDKQQKLCSFLNELKKKLGSKREELTQWACSASATQYASLAPIVVKHAKKNNLLAVTLLKQAAKHIEVVLSQFLDKSDKSQKTFPCAFTGGMAPILMGYIKKNSCKKLSEPLYDPCQGAILMVKAKRQDKNKL